MRLRGDPRCHLAGGRAKLFSFIHCYYAPSPLPNPELLLVPKPHASQVWALLQAARNAQNLDGTPVSQSIE